MPAWRLSLLRPNYLPVTPELFSVMREKCPCYCPDPYLMVLAQTFEHKSYCDADLNRCLTILPIFFLFVRAEPRPAPGPSSAWRRRHRRRNAGLRTAEPVGKPGRRFDQIAEPASGPTTGDRPARDSGLRRDGALAVSPSSPGCPATGFRVAPKAL